MLPEKSPLVAEMSPSMVVLPDMPKLPFICPCEAVILPVDTISPLAVKSPSTSPEWSWNCPHILTPLTSSDLTVMLANPPPPFEVVETLFDVAFLFPKLFISIIFLYFDFSFIVEVLLLTSSLMATT